MDETNYCNFNFWLLKVNFISVFKSTSKKEKNSTSYFNIIKLWESTILQFKHENAEYEVMFMDGFSMNSRYNKHYTWSNVSDKGSIRIGYDNF